MKILLTGKAKRNIGYAAGMFLIAAFLFSIAGYTFGVKYKNVSVVTADPGIFETRNRLLMETIKSVGVCTSENAMRVWVEGLKTRNAATQYVVMNEKLKSEYVQQLEQSCPNWVTGMSSPWVDGYQIVETETPNEEVCIYQLIISTKTSDGNAGDYNAVITTTKEENFWRISKIVMDQGLYAYTGFETNNLDS